MSDDDDGSGFGCIIGKFVSGVGAFALCGRRWYEGAVDEIVTCQDCLALEPAADADRWTAGRHRWTAGRHRVFVYGTLRAGQGNHRLLKGSHCVSPRCGVRGWRMWDLGAFPAVTPTPAEESWVTGELYEVDDATLARLDLLEGVPRFYKRVATGCAFEVVWIYAMNTLPMQARAIESGDWNERWTEEELDEHEQRTGERLDEEREGAGDDDSNE